MKTFISLFHLFFLTKCIASYRLAENQLYIERAGSETIKQFYGELVAHEERRQII